jgi:hypothetical protein
MLHDTDLDLAARDYERYRAGTAAERNLCPACVSYADCICTCHLCGAYLDPDEGRSMCRPCAEAERGWRQAEWEREL